MTAVAILLFVAITIGLVLALRGEAKRQARRRYEASLARAARRVTVTIRAEVAPMMRQLGIAAAQTAEAIKRCEAAMKDGPR